MFNLELKRTFEVSDSRSLIKKRSEDFSECGLSCFIYKMEVTDGGFGEDGMKQGNNTSSTRVSCPFIAASSSDHGFNWKVLDQGLGI